jgi:hypothetical protein
MAGSREEVLELGAVLMVEKDGQWAEGVSCLARKGSGRVTEEAGIFNEWFLLERIVGEWL